jgi:hypothetical protein
MCEREMSTSLGDSPQTPESPKRIIVEYAECVPGCGDDFCPYIHQNVYLDQLSEAEQQRYLDRMKDC